MKIQTTMMMCLGLTLAALNVGCGSMDMQADSAAASAPNGAAVAMNEPAGAERAPQQIQEKQTRRMPLNKADQGMIQQTIAQWPERPKLGAQMMLSKYGAPQEVTSERIVWHNVGPYKRITVTKQEDHHDFPLPHMDFLEHTISYQVPADKADALAKYDGSCTFDRTRGELSARCDLEAHNILTLNPANDIVTGKKDAEAARKAFGENVVQDVLGKKPAYVTALQFQPATQKAAFSDVPTIPGAPMRPASAQTKNIQGDKSQGEILGLIVAVNLNEITAAMAADQKKLNPQVADYAKMLHQEHGINTQQTLQLGEKINVTPLMTPATDALQKKGAAQLASIVPLEGEQFSRAFVDMMVKGHTEALQMLDSQLAKVNNEELKGHLTETRQHIAEHLQQAKRLQEMPMSEAAGAENRTGAEHHGQQHQR